MDTGTIYLESALKQFRQAKALAEKAIEQLMEEQLFLSFNDDTNSISVIIQHMHGNMMSRWTDFLTTDGEKPWRKRDEEFEVIIDDKTRLMALWNEGWDCVFSAMGSLNTGHLTQTVYIRSEAHTVIDAINRQLTHYAYHVGQIVYAAKQLKHGEWNSLTIPKRKK